MPYPIRAFAGWGDVRVHRDDFRQMEEELTQLRIQRRCNESEIIRLREIVGRLAGGSCLAYSSHDTPYCFYCGGRWRGRREVRSDPDDGWVFRHADDCLFVAAQEAIKPKE